MWGGLDECVPGGAEIVPAHVVDEDDDDVRPLRHGRHRSFLGGLSAAPDQERRERHGQEPTLTTVSLHGHSSFGLSAANALATLVWPGSIASERRKIARASSEPADSHIAVAECVQLARVGRPERDGALEVRHGTLEILFEVVRGPRGPLRRRTRAHTRPAMGSKSSRARSGCCRRLYALASFQRAGARVSFAATACWSSSTASSSLPTARSWSAMASSTRPGSSAGNWRRAMKLGPRDRGPRRDLKRRLGSRQARPGGV